MPETALPDTTIARIRAALAGLDDGAQIDLIDDSAAHAGHAGAASGGGHYTLRMTASCFAGLTRMARHRLVYDALAPLMRRDVHALSMTLLTPDEVRHRPHD